MRLSGTGFNIRDDCRSAAQPSEEFTGGDERKIEEEFMGEPVEQ